jgi:glycosyltransferase involved in cell wall biosynthesis
MRAALLTNILTPYRVPVYRSLARSRTGTGAGATMDWRVLTNAATEFDRGWRVDAEDLDVECVRGVSVQREFAFGGDRARQRVTTHLPLGLPAALRRFAPDVVVSAELGPRTLLAWLYCRTFRIPFVIWSYHSRQSAHCGPVLRRLRRRLVRSADALVGMGVQAREVLRELGAHDGDIFDAPNAHDVEGLRAALDWADPGELRDRLEVEVGLRGNVALVPGRLVAGKGVGPLLDAWDRIPEPVRSQWSLLFLGDGPLAEQVHLAIDARPRGELVCVPAVAPSAMAEFYLLADLVVFPSLGDPWGLVVNEAMACGTPVLCSSRAGCSDDLIRADDNGWIADPAHPEHFAEVLLKALEHPGREALGVAAERSITACSPVRMADGILAAVDHALRP